MTPEGPGFGSAMPPAPPPPPYGARPSGLGPTSGSGERLPWVDRQTLGFVPALVETVKLVVTKPQDAFSRLRVDGDYISPFLFGMLIAWVMSLIGQMWQLVFGSVMSMGDNQAMAMMGGSGLISLVVVAVVFPLIYVIVIFLWAGLYHLALMVLSGLDSSELGFEGTFKIVSYAMVAQIASIVPFVGPFIGMIAMVILLVIGFQNAHRTTQGKAIAAALIPLILCCLCAILGAVLFGGALAAAMAGAMNQ